VLQVTKKVLVVEVLQKQDKQVRQHQESQVEVELVQHRVLMELQHKEQVEVLEVQVQVGHQAQQQVAVVQVDSVQM
tara:strand:+ start:208 stop:435 length:228 start_codon:yes stop_codon:yes gene_type:complete